jgi:hypothetical protein
MDDKFPGELVVAGASVIGCRDFVDGSRRLVYEDDRGQFVIDDDCQRVYGTFLLADEPVIIYANRPNGH